MNLLPVLLKDGYKVGHIFQYPSDTTLVYSNLTARGSRVPGWTKGVIAFGLQYFICEYLERRFQDYFFSEPRDRVLADYERRIRNYLGTGISLAHIDALHQLGYLPLEIRAVSEGTLVPFRVPLLTIHNTKPEFFWLTNMLETILCSVVWLGCTSATTAFRYRRVFEDYAGQTGASRDFVRFQGHDFSFRGLPGAEAAMISGAAHLLSFLGTDTIPAIDFLEHYYGADSDREVVGLSVPATEHSVMCMGGDACEFDTIKRLITQVYPSGIVSIVCDTWDFWKVLTDYLPRLKNEIMARPGKVVVRPDSGDPVKIICGDAHERFLNQAAAHGAIETLWYHFGGTTNAEGYRELDPHVGLIYGDSITPERQVAILAGLKARKFASSNVVLGIGSFTYQYVTRDTYGFAMKATYGETTSGGPQPIFKKPATDDGTKNSARGLLRVSNEAGVIVLEENVSWEHAKTGLLDLIYRDGTLQRFQSLKEIRARVEAQV
jgi:nicotinamide phosphoribosyltransferase